MGAVHKSVLCGALIPSKAFKGACQRSFVLDCRLNSQHFSALLSNALNARPKVFHITSADSSAKSWRACYDGLTDDTCLLINAEHTYKSTKCKHPSKRCRQAKTKFTPQSICSKMPALPKWTVHCMLTCCRTLWWLNLGSAVPSILSASLVPRMPTSAAMNMFQMECSLLHDYSG